MVLGTALFVFTNERGFSHPVADGDIALALAAFLLLLLAASRTTLPAWAARAAYASAAIVDGLAGYRIGGGIGAVVVVAAIALVAPRASRFALPPLALLASLAANYALLRALADPAHPSPLPPLEAFAAIVVPVATLPFVLRDRELALARWGAWLVATGMLSLLTERYTMRVSAVVAPDDVLLSAGGVVLAIAATRLRSARWSRVVGASALAALAVTVPLLLFGSSYVSDATVAVDAAATATLRGEDPYASVDIERAVLDRGLSPDLFTKFEGGTGIERRYVYPAASFLPSAVAKALGVGDVRWVFFALLLVAYGLALARVPRTLGAYVGALALVDVMAVRQTTLAGVEPSWALLLLVALLFPATSAVAGGLAAAARQTAWLYLPWLFLDRLREGPRRALRWALVVLAAFVVVNAPFALPALGAWSDAVVAPFLAPYEPLGFGIVRWSTDGPLPLAPRAAFTAATLVAAALSLWTYWRHRPAWRYGIAVLPVAPLFVAWRSLQNYFMFAPLFLLAVIGRDVDAP